MGQVQGGTGTELTTRGKIFVDTKKITKLRTDSCGPNGPGWNGGGDDTEGVPDSEGGSSNSLIISGDPIPVRFHEYKLGYL